MAKYLLTATAKQTLDKEIAHSAKYWGKAHAKKYKQGLLVAIRKILQHPTLYAVQPKIGKNMRCVRYKGNYIIYYVADNGKDIVVTNLPSVYQNK